MSEEAIEEALDDCKNFMNIGDYIGEKEYKELQIAMNYIDKLQKENQDYKKLILGIKGKLNNIQFEVEQSWRKIEKLESKYE